MESFININSFVWAVEMTHTNEQKRTRTHTLGLNATYLIKMTEYKQGLILEVNLKSRPFLSQMKPFPNVQIFTRLMK